MIFRLTYFISNAKYKKELGLLIMLEFSKLTFSVPSVCEVDASWLDLISVSCSPCLLKFIESIS